jgi:uncharacterized protein YacL
MNLFAPTKILRFAFIAIAIALGITASAGLDAPKRVGALGGGIFGTLVVFLDLAWKNLSFRQFSNATVGLLVGLLCGVLVNYALDEFFILGGVTAEFGFATAITQVGINFALVYWGMSLAIRANRQEFSFIIPYVRFRQDSTQDSPLLVDSNIIIDGRVAKLCETGFLSGALVVPRFVLDEMHVLADSSNQTKRERGKRGLDYLREMQESPSLEITVQEDYHSTEEPTDTKLIQLAKRVGARLLTNDRNLGRVAQLQGVTVLNLNDLAQAMRPNIIAGEPMAIKLLKEGKDDHQAVGYLEDGTMIVVNHAIKHLGETVNVIIGSPLQTSAGRLIFAELPENAAGLTESKR